MHYISQPSPLIIPLLLRVRAKKQIMSVFGGELNHFWKRPWDKVVSWLVNKKIRRLTVQTDYQKRMLNETRLEIPAKKIPPLIPIVERTCERREKPRLLFMSHMEESKGIDDVLDAFVILKEKIKNLVLVIADSGLSKRSEVYERIKKIGEGIILKKIVNPQDELSKAWVYLYPVRSAKETFSVPLSLIESIQVGTPYVTTKVGGILEYFDFRAAVEPENAESLARKIEKLIERPVVYPMTQKIDNEKAAEEYLKMY
jgi:glycosyltransferase involved in cell wall biosynthesis